MTDNDANKKKNIRRTALIVSGIAIVFYVGFVLSGVLRA